MKETTKDWQEESPIAANNRRIPKTRRKEEGPGIRFRFSARIFVEPVCAVMMKNLVV